MDYAERYPRWQWLSLELPTEDAVPQREQGVPCRECSISKSLKNKQKMLPTAFCYPKLTNSGFKDSFGIKSKEKKLEVY